MVKFSAKETKMVKLRRLTLQDESGKILRYKSENGEITEINPTRRKW